MVSVVLVAVALVVLLVARQHRGSASIATTSAVPVGAPLSGNFDGATMRCPGSSQSAVGDTCVIPLSLAGDVTVHLSWTGGDAKTLVALGMRDSQGKDLGPQVTGRGGTADFKAKGLVVGTFQLRVVNVQAAHGLAFAVTLH